MRFIFVYKIRIKHWKLETIFCKQFWIFNNKCQKCTILKTTLQFFPKWNTIKPELNLLTNTLMSILSKSAMFCKLWQAVETSTSGPEPLLLFLFYLCHNFLQQLNITVWTGSQFFLLWFSPHVFHQGCGQVKEGDQILYRNFCLSTIFETLFRINDSNGVGID